MQARPIVQIDGIVEREYSVWLHFRLATLRRAAERVWAWSAAQRVAVLEGRHSACVATAKTWHPWRRDAVTGGFEMFGVRG